MNLGDILRANEGDHPPIKLRPGQSCVIIEADGSAAGLIVAKPAKDDEPVCVGAQYAGMMTAMLTDRGKAILEKAVEWWNDIVSEG